jgi:hypothetical protein
MVFSKRERVVIALTSAALALLVLDHYVVEEFWTARTEAKRRRAVLADKEFSDKLLLQTGREMGGKWQEMLARDGMTSQPQQAESQLLHAVDGWAKDAKIKLSSVVPQERLGSGTSLLPEMCFHASGEGNMAAVSGFIWRLETAQFPLKIQKVVINSQKPGADSLRVEVDFSTIYAPGDSQTPPGDSVRTASTGGEKK